MYFVQTQVCSKTLPGVQVPSRLLLLQHGEDDLRGLPAGLRAHLQVRLATTFAWFCPYKR